MLKKISIYLLKVKNFNVQNTLRDINIILKRCMKEVRQIN